jgi:hypothetical protein
MAFSILGEMPQLGMRQPPANGNAKNGQMAQKVFKGEFGNWDGMG